MSTKGGGLLTTEKVYNFNQNQRTRKTEIQSALSRIAHAFDVGQYERGFGTYKTLFFLQSQGPMELSTYVGRRLIGEGD